MKEYKSADIRNIAIVGHGGSGKTMLSEAILVCSGVINRMGSIANGNTVSDYHEDEQARQISIHASLLHTEWQGKKLNIIDTPGYSDFISESLGALTGRGCCFGGCRCGSRSASGHGPGMGIRNEFRDPQNLGHQWPR